MQMLIHFFAKKEKKSEKLSENRRWVVGTHRLFDGQKE